jgi:lysophospholipase L1-like esterase
MLAGVGKSRLIAAVVAGLGLALGGAWGFPAQAAVAHKSARPIVGHRIAGHRPLSAFTASPKHLRGPRKPVPGKMARLARPTRPTRVQRAESAAVARARRTGRPVVVAAETTPTVEVTAHPSGLLSMTSNVFPVRVKVHGVWRAIDPKLRRTSSGWAAAVASVPVTFSPGGNGPLVTMANPAGQTVSLYWSGALPRPVVSGSVALYRDVLPGVDLRMEATGTGYQEALVVRDAAAAANPRLRSLAFLVKAGSGLVLRRGPGSSLGVFAAGKLIFVVGRPLMWDSSHTQHFGIPAAADAPGSGRVTPVPVGYRLASRSAATITMAPPASVLTGARVRYPLFIDPELSNNTNFYAQVMKVSNGYTQEWDTTSGSTSVGSGIVEVGDCDYPSCVWDIPPAVQGYVDRDYFRFPTPALQLSHGQSATVYRVIFSISEQGNSDGCTSRVSDIYSTTGGISSSTSWGGPQGSQIAQASSNNGGGSSCPPGNVDFDSNDTGNGPLKTTLQSAANNGDSAVTLELRADDETFKVQYKTYKDNPSLSVYYNFAPLVPTNLSVQDQVTCDPSTTYTSLTQPKLFATGTDNNPNPVQITLNYTLQTSSGTAVPLPPGPTGGSGSQQSTTPSVALTNGTAYQFKVSATNNVNLPALPRTGPTSAWYPFTVLTGPTVAPTISSFDYPQGQWGQAAGAPGEFTVGTGGASHIDGFAYSFDGGTGSEPVPSTTDCSYNNDGGLGTSVDSNGDGLGSSNGELALVHGSTAQIEIPKGITSGQHTLFVVSFDSAHNVSSEAAYTFYVAPNYQATSQPVTYINGSSLVAGATGANASLVTTQANCCGLGWRGGSQLIFNATAVNQTFIVTINVPDAGWWQIGADMTTAQDYGKARVDLDQNTNLGGTATLPFDEYNPIVSLSYMDLGTANLTAGTHTLTFTMTGQNANSAGFKAGINYITLSPTSRYEGESLPTGTPTAGAIITQVQANPPWSDNSQLFLQNTTLGARYTVTFNAPVESDYALGVNLTTANDYGSVRIDLDPAASNINLDNTATSPLDEYSATVSATYVFLGGVHLTAGQHVLQVTVVGTDPSSVNNRYNSGIDFLEVVPVTGATDASFTAAMNNLGIATDGAASFAGNFDLTGNATGKNLSLNAMQDAGITPGTTTAAGTTFTLNGATFQMPKISATGDNVIPDGQTIPLPAVKATDVALLAATTCGLPASPAMNATLNYSNGSSNQPLITPVTDWSHAGPAQILLDHWDAGTTADTSRQPHLYEVFLPANPAATLSSITLPLMPVNFLTNTQSCVTAANVLHILAIGTRPASAGQGPTGSAWTGTYAGPMDTTVTPAGGSLNNTTVREVISTTATGSGSIRIQLSNFGSMVPVTFDAVTAGAQASGEATVAAPVAVKFGGLASVTIPAGGDVTSDAITAPTGWAGKLVVSLHVPSTSVQATVPAHQSPNASTFVATGNQTANSDGTPFTTANSTAGLFYLARVDASDSTATDGTVAVLGDQTAEQAPAGTFANWASHLPAALGSAAVALPGSAISVASGVTSNVTAADALAWLRNYVTAEPNLRDVIISVGANDVLAGQPAATIESNLRALVVAIRGYFVDNDPSLQGVQVVLTTIVPLSLASTDAREAVRQAVNSWITGNNTTAQVTSDVATAVADPANPNNVAPSLLSGGVPTAQYYTDVANQIAADVSNAIPVFLNGL